MGETSLRIMFPHDAKHTVSAYLPPEAAEHWMMLTKENGIEPRKALVLTAAAFKSVCIAITTETKDQIEARDVRHGVKYTRTPFTDWIETEQGRKKDGC